MARYGNRTHRLRQAADDLIGGKSGRGYGQIAIETDEPLNDALYNENVCNVDIDFISSFIGDIS